MKLIDKDALVAEIRRRQKIHFNDYHINGNNSPADYGACNALTQILDFIDTIEVKEVDLDKEFESFLDNIEGVPRMWHSDEQIEWAKDIAQHFFELGLKA